MTTGKPLAAPSDDHPEGEEFFQPGGVLHPTQSGLESGTPLENNCREAVITIQGGGVYGLSLLGQLKEVIEGDHAFTPIALAGTSAGAILATLLWAKLTPTQIEEKLIAHAQSHGGTLFDLLGPFGIEKTSSAIKRFEKFIIRLKRLTNSSTARRWGCRWAVEWLDFWLAVLQVRGAIHRHLPHRGLFSGENLERFIENCLDDLPDVKQMSGRPPNEPLKFSHFNHLRKANGKPSYRPPLFIAVTNLTTQRLELINSVESEYQNVSIAKAVRASAGFPCFLHPVEIPRASQKDCCVDGGLVSNYPTWVFSSLFRQMVERSDDFRGLASKAWIHVGLRVSADQKGLEDLRDPTQFARAIVAMLTGGARNFLEEQLAKAVPRSVTIRQTRAQTGGPKGVLDVAKINVATIKQMVKKGCEHAENALKDLPSSTLCLPNDGSIEAEIEGLLKRCEALLGSHTNAAKLRANVFLAFRTKLRLMFAVRMDGDTDRNFAFNFDAGLTGRCYTTRSPVLCNLAHLHALRPQLDGNHLQPGDVCGLTGDEIAKVPADRTWLASVPIFDPFDSAMEPERVSIRPWTHAPHTLTVKTHWRGGVLGVLNVDAAWDYSALGLLEDPHSHAAEPRIRAILDLMQACAQRLGWQLAQRFDSSVGP